MKSEAAVNRDCLPYLYDNFNITAWYVKQVKTTIPTVGKIQNALVAAFNEYPHLPCYIFIIPDKDIITSIKTYDNGVKKCTTTCIG